MKTYLEAFEIETGKVVRRREITNQSETSRAMDVRHFQKSVDAAKFGVRTVRFSDDENRTNETRIVIEVHAA